MAEFNHITMSIDDNDIVSIEQQMDGFSESIHLYRTELAKIAARAGLMTYDPTGMTRVSRQLQMLRDQIACLASWLGKVPDYPDHKHFADALALMADNFVAALPDERHTADQGNHQADA